MKVVDAGHRYLLDHLDDVMGKKQELTFVKREGEGYPGNVGSHPGTNIQEVLRALIDRVIYLDNQIPAGQNKFVLHELRMALYYLEQRAAERHHRHLPSMDLDLIEQLPTCKRCGHIYCPGKHV